MLVLEIIAVAALSAALARYLRQAPAAAGLRRWLGERWPTLDRLVSCPHCLSFWIAAAAGALLWRAGSLSPLEAALVVLLGWRGAHYLNRALDRRAGQRRRRSAQSCRTCGAPYDEERFLERRGLAFCSTRCWFDYLRSRPVPQERLVSPAGDLIPQEIYPMSYRDISPEQARQLLDGAGRCVYLDVRSVPEFRNGHPIGAVNVPLLHREAMGMVPNPDFLAVVQAHFDRDTPLLVGCQSGQRSVRAAQALVACGFTDVANVKGGFGGARTAGGQVVERGWFELGLPVDYGDPEGRCYADLAGALRRPSR